MFIWKELPSGIMIGRWLELRVVRVRYSESIAMWEVAFVWSGEVGFPRERRWVEESRLRSVKLESEAFGDEGTHSLRPVTCCFRVQDGAVGVEVSHDEVTTEDKERVKFSVKS